MPATFQAGPHEWRLNLPFGLMKKINDQLGVDLTKLTDDEHGVLHLLFTNTGKLAEVLWTACENQAGELGIDAEGFGMLLTPEVIEAATDALMEAVIDFFPRARGRDALKESWKRAKTTLESVNNKVIMKAIAKTEAKLTAAAESESLTSSGTVAKSPE